MFSRIAFILAWLRRVAASQADLLIENLALRQQFAILTAKRPRPRMRAAHRFFWVALRRFWPRWKGRWSSSGPTGLCAGTERAFGSTGPGSRGGGAPRIHGELLMLGFDGSERTSSRVMPRRPADPEARQRWRNFIRNHREALAVIVLNERHLHRLLPEFVAYDHDDRTHLGLGKSTPSMRTATSQPHRDAESVGDQRIGGHPHRYEWRRAA